MSGSMQAVQLHPDNSG